MRKASVLQFSFPTQTENCQLFLRQYVRFQKAAAAETFGRQCRRLLKLFGAAFLQRLIPSHELQLREVSMYVCIGAPMLAVALLLMDQSQHSTSPAETIWTVIGQLFLLAVISASLWYASAVVFAKFRRQQLRLLRWILPELEGFCKAFEPIVVRIDSTLRPDWTGDYQLRYSQQLMHFSCSGPSREFCDILEGRLCSTILADSIISRQQLYSCLFTELEDQLDWLRFRLVLQKKLSFGSQSAANDDPQ